MAVAVHPVSWCIKYNDFRGMQAPSSTDNIPLLDINLCYHVGSDKLIGKTYYI